MRVLQTRAPGSGPQEGTASNAESLNTESLGSDSVLTEGRADQQNNLANLMPATTLHSPYTSLHLFADIAASFPEYPNAPMTDTHAQTSTIDSATRLSVVTSASSQCPEAHTRTEPVRAHQPDEDDELDGLDEIAYWSQPEFPDVSPELRALISNTYMPNPQSRRGKQLYLKGKDQPPTAYKLVDESTKVRTIRSLAIQEMVRSLFLLQETPLMTVGT